MVISDFLFFYLFLLPDHTFLSLLLIAVRSGEIIVINVIYLYTIYETYFLYRSDLDFRIDLIHYRCSLLETYVSINPTFIFLFFSLWYI